MSESEERKLPTEHADETSGTGGADSPEEAVGGVSSDETDQEESAGDQDSGPTGTAEQVDVDEQRDQAEG